MENAYTLLNCFAELQHFRAMRLQQMKQEQQQRMSLESQGHGVLTEVSQTHLQASKSLIHEEAEPTQRPVHKTLQAASAGSHELRISTTVSHVCQRYSGDHFML